MRQNLFAATECLFLLAEALIDRCRFSFGLRFSCYPEGTFPVQLPDSYGVAT
jgi:hypothetical protein